MFLGDGMREMDDESLADPTSTCIVLLAFVVFGSLLFELLRLFPVAWDFVRKFVAQIIAIFK